MLLAGGGGGLGKMGGRSAWILETAWAHLLMNSQAENASPNIWAQLRPSDIPPHLKRVTCTN